jgi:hypothetical protein
LNLSKLKGKWCPLPTLIEKNVADTIKYLTDIKDPPSVLIVEGTSGTVYILGQ